MISEPLKNVPLLWLQSLRCPHASDHKYTRGHALIWGGYPMTGAGRLAARAAARIGAGIVTVAVPAEALPIYAAALTSILVHPIVSFPDLVSLLEKRTFSSLLIGPGAGVTEDTRQRTLMMLEKGIPIVLDADALTLFQNDLSPLIQAITGPCVLTPHEGEFKRLFEFDGDRLSRARSAAKLTGAIVILKGSETVIAAPDGRAIINDNAPPTLATAGSGDVLSGMIAGLLAQTMEPFLAAAAAVWMHSAAAVKFGPGLIAEDLPELIPAVLRDLERGGALRTGFSGLG